MEKMSGQNERGRQLPIPEETRTERLVAAERRENRGSPSNPRKKGGGLLNSRGVLFVYRKKNDPFKTEKVKKGVVGEIILGVVF